MTFDEAIKVLGEGLLTDKINFGDSTFVLKRNITNLDTIQIINDLRKEYAPTIEMTKEDKEAMLQLKNEYSFADFYITIVKWRQNRQGLSVPYEQLTEKQLMYAWLNPENIKVIGE